MCCRMFVVLLAGAVLASLTGCAENKLTKRNFDMLKKGTSTQLEVEYTLGEDYVVRGQGNREWEYEDEKRHLSVYIHFDENGKVERKEWITNEGWEGAAPGIDENPEGKKVSEEDSSMTLDKG